MEGFRRKGHRLPFPGPARRRPQVRIFRLYGPDRGGPRRGPARRRRLARRSPAQRLVGLRRYRSDAFLRRVRRPVRRHGAAHRSGWIGQGARHPEALRRPHRPPHRGGRRHPAFRSGSGADRDRIHTPRRGPQPHLHAPAPCGPAPRARRPCASGGFSGHAGSPALRLLAHRAHDPGRAGRRGTRRERRDHGRLPVDRQAHGPAGRHRHGRYGALRRKVRRHRARGDHRQPGSHRVRRALRRHASAQHRPGGQFRHPVRKRHCCGHAPHRGRDRLERPQARPRHERGAAPACGHAQDAARRACRQAGRPPERKPRAPQGSGKGRRAGRVRAGRGSHVQGRGDQRREGACRETRRQQHQGHARAHGRHPLQDAFRRGLHRRPRGRGQGEHDPVCFQGSARTLHRTRADQGSCRAHCRFRRRTPRSGSGRRHEPGGH